MREGTIVAEHVWKRFRADRSRLLLRDRLGVAASRLRGRRRGWTWVLRDVGLRVDPGASVGLIGANGSGKSTLLKILTRVMDPYAGRVSVAGRVGALIEVRAGIHPDLTGRENVYLTGSLLGLKRSAVAARFDDIVAFAELDDAIDRQVKFYSTGMQMRIGFAVAAFLEPHVLLVDEVLAVGDASFQQKCLDRMRYVLGQGTTLVLVSHDLAAVESTCREAVWLRRGEVAMQGDVREVLAGYRGSIEAAAELQEDVGGLVRIVKARAAGPDELGPRTHHELGLELVLRAAARHQGYLFLGVSQGPATPIFTVTHQLTLEPGETEVRCALADLPLPRGRYYVWVGVLTKGTDPLPWHPAFHFDVAGPDLDPAPTAVVRLAPVHVASSWEIARI